MDIYKIITSRQKYSLEQKKNLIRLNFNKIIGNIREISHTDELPKSLTSIGILFQHIKDDIINILESCCPFAERDYIRQKLYLDIEWNKFIFNKFRSLKSKDLMLWFFFSVPYYVNFDHDKYYIILDNMLDYTIANWPSDLYFSEEEFLYISNETCMLYPISYLPINVCPILIKYCSLLRKIVPDLNFIGTSVSKYLLKTSSRGANIESAINLQDLTNDNMSNKNINNKNEDKNPVKICFISDSFSKDTCVLRDRVGIITQLFNDSSLDIYFASFNSDKDITGDVAKIFYKNIKHKYIFLDSIQSAKTIIDNFNFNIIVYPDIGMKIKPYMLAFSRLAPLQINTWGHSETSGIDTIDLFVSSKYFHNTIKSPNTINNSNNIDISKLVSSQFSEKLYLMNSLSTYYFSPKQLFLKNNITKFKSRAELGFSEKDNIYGCLQTFYKFNLEFENCLNNILINDPNGILLLSNNIPYCKKHLSRIKKKFKNNVDRIKWYPPLSKNEYLNVISICDVILDPYPFGGCNTSYDAFDFNKPVITYPSTKLSGNFTKGLYQKMNIYDYELIVNNLKDYYINSVNIACNVKLKNKLSRKIRDNKENIYTDKESIKEWKKLFYLKFKYLE